MGRSTGIAVDGDDRSGAVAYNYPVLDSDCLSLKGAQILIKPYVHRELQI